MNGWRMSASKAPTKKLKMIPFIDFPFCVPDALALHTETEVLSRAYAS